MDCNPPLKLMYAMGKKSQTKQNYTWKVFPLFYIGKKYICYASTQNSHIQNASRELTNYCVRIENIRNIGL